MQNGQQAALDLEHGLIKQLQLEPQDQLKIVLALNAKASAQALTLRKTDVTAFLECFDAAKPSRDNTIFSAHNAGTSAHAVEGYLRGAALQHALEHS